MLCNNIRMAIRLESDDVVEIQQIIDNHKDDELAKGPIGVSETQAYASFKQYFALSSYSNVFAVISAYKNLDTKIIALRTEFDGQDAFFEHMEGMLAGNPNPLLSQQNLRQFARMQIPKLRQQKHDIEVAGQTFDTAVEDFTRYFSYRTQMVQKIANHLVQVYTDKKKAKMATYETLRAQVDAKITYFESLAPGEDAAAQPAGANKRPATATLRFTVPHD